MATWLSIVWDQSRQDQLTTVGDDQGNTTQQRIQTWVCTADPGGGKPNLADVYTASVGGVTIPLVGADYTVEGQTDYTCKQTYPRRTSESPYVIEVQVTYERKFIYQPPDTSKWNIKISISGSEVTQTAYQGTLVNSDGSPNSDSLGAGQDDLVNSAGQAFDPSVEKTYYDEQITVSYNSTTPPDFSSLRGCTNSSSVSFTISGVSRTFATNQLLLKEYSLSTTATLNDMSTAVWSVSATLIGRTDTFTRHILDQGYYTLDDSGDLVAIKDKYGENLASPARLDGTGNKLGDDAAPVYINFNIEDQADLNPVFDGLS